MDIGSTAYVPVPNTPLYARIRRRITVVGAEDAEVGDAVEDHWRFLALKELIRLLREPGTADRLKDYSGCPGAILAAAPGRLRTGRSR